VTTDSHTKLAESVLRNPNELARDASSRLGAWEPWIRRIVTDMNKVHWFARVGEISDYTNGNGHLRSLRRGARRRVKAVDDVDLALSLRRDELQIDDQYWGLLENLGRNQNLFEIMIAAEDYWVAAFNFGLHSPRVSEDKVDQFLPFVRSDIVGALREAVLGDGAGIYYFSDALFWYRKGHFRCGLRDGFELVY